MARTSNRLFMSLTIFCSAFMLQTAHAEQTPVTDSNQLVIHFPDVDHELLIEQIKTLRSQQIQSKQALVQIVADKKPDGSDALITVIMPGGLLYAGYKKASYELAKNELARISADIEESTSDILAMQSMSESVIDARLH